MAMPQLLLYFCMNILCSISTHILMEFLGACSACEFSQPAVLCFVLLVRYSCSEFTDGDA